MRRGTTALALVTAVLLVATPARAAEPSTATNERSRPAQGQQLVRTSSAQDGKDAFRAIFFLQGPDAPALLEAGAGRDLSAAERARLLGLAAEAQAQAVVDEVVAELEARDPAYFVRLADRLATGSPAAVESVLNRTTSDINASSTFATAAASADTVETYLPGESARPDCAVVVLVFAGAVIAVAAFAAVNLAIAANIAAGYNVAAGTNVYYQNNYTRTRSGQLLGDAPSDRSYVLTVTQQFADATL